MSEFFPSTTHLSSPVVLILGVGLGSEPFIQELLQHQITVVVVDQKPILSSALTQHGKESGLLTVIPHDFSDLNMVEEVIARYHVTHTLALPVGRSLTKLGQINDRHHFLGPSFTAVDTCTDKIKFHHFLEQHSLNAPRYMVLPPRNEVKDKRKNAYALSNNELQQVQDNLGFPLIIKPSCGSGSQGVRYCGDMSTLKSYLLPERFASQSILLEEVIAGTEYSTNFFVDNYGAIHMIGLYAKEISSLPFRQEVAYFVDDYSEPFAHIYPYLQSMVKALGSGCHSSFFQCDLILTANNQPYAIDISPRMAGNIVILLEQFCGMSPIKLFVDHVLHSQALGTTEKLPIPSQKAVLRFFSYAHAGTVQAIVPQLSTEEQRHIVSLKNNLHIGSSVGPMADGRGLAQGHIMIAHDDTAEANNLTHRYLDSFIVTTKEKSPITYEDFDCCPLCGSKHFTALPERHEITNATPMPASELGQNAIIHFTPALCENCGASFNLRGLSGHSRDLLYPNYKFIRPSTGIGAENYQTYINTVRDMAQQLQLSKDAPILEVGGYDGYLLQELAREGWQDLTLIDPSAQLDCIPPELHIKAIKDFFGNSTAKEYPEHFNLIACKDTVYMVPRIPDFISGLVNCLKPNGMLLLTAVEPFNMHALQYARLGKNSFAYIAHAYGLELIDYFKKPGNTYACAIFRKPATAQQNIINPEEVVASDSTEHHTSKFIAEQERIRQQLQNTKPFALEAITDLEQKVQAALKRSGPIVVYGTGFAAFNFLDCLSDATKQQLFAPVEGQNPSLSPSRLVLVNSDPQQEGYFFLLPNGENHIVHYAGNALKNQHVALVIVGALNIFFRQEIISLLKQLNCSYDDIFSATPV